MSTSRRVFLRSAAFAGCLSALSAARVSALNQGRSKRPFRWDDAYRRATVEHAAIAENTDAIALQVARPLSARGKFFGPSWTSLLSPRADLWLLNGEMECAARLSVLPGGAWSPCFSPDGQRLAALTLVAPGKVGMVIWELSQRTYRTFSEPNVELFLAKFRTARSAYGGPTTFFQVPRQYLWCEPNSILYVDHGPVHPEWVLAFSSITSKLQGMRRRTADGRRSVRVWSDGSPTCGAGSRLVRVMCDTGKMETLYEGDVRGVSLSPNGRWLAVVIATENIRPIPDEPVSWPLLATTGFDDAMVELRLRLVDMLNPGKVREVEGITAVGNVAPSRLPRWSADSCSVALPVRRTYSDAAATADDAVWVVNAATGAARMWRASSALDAELLVAMLTTEGLNADKVVARRPQKLRLEDYIVGGQIRGGAWRCAPGQVLFWNAPELTLLTSGHIESLRGNFVSVQPTVRDNTVARTVAVRDDGNTHVITAASGSYTIEALTTPPYGSLLAVRPRDCAAVFSDDTDARTSLILTRPGRRRRRSSLSFNTYFREVIVPQRRILSHTFPDGSVRRGLLQLPIGHRPGNRHPVIVWAYPNSKPSLNDSFARANSYSNVIYPVQYLLTKGFAFFQAPFPIERKQSEWPMQAAADAVLPWVDVLAGTGEIIPEACGFFGHSNAGYVALALEALTNCFKAIVAWGTFPEIGFDTLHSWVSDVALNCGANVVQADRMFYEDPKQPYAAQPAPPWRGAVQYIRNDPVFNLNHATTPLLLIEGEFDTDPRETEEVYSILYGRGIPVELAYYWGEGHVFSSPDNIHDSWSRTEKFFRRYLVIGQ